MQTNAIRVTRFLRYAALSPTDTKAPQQLQTLSFDSPVVGATNDWHFGHLDHITYSASGSATKAKLRVDDLI